MGRGLGELRGNFIDSKPQPFQLKRLQMGIYPWEQGGWGRDAGCAEEPHPHPLFEIDVQPLSHTMNESTSTVDGKVDTLAGGDVVNKRTAL